MTSLPTTPLFADPRRLLLEMAREHALPDLLRLVVDRLGEAPTGALGRGLLKRGARRAGFPRGAAAGRSAVDAEVEGPRLDGAFRRFPLGVRKVGQIAATG